MKTKFFRHTAFALLAAAFGIVASSSPVAALPDFMWEVSPEILTMIPVSQPDLKDCTVRGILLKAQDSDFDLALNVDCGGEKVVKVKAGDIDRLKMVYSQALAAYLSPDMKVSFGKVTKWPTTEHYTATVFSTLK